MLGRKRKRAGLALAAGSFLLFFLAASAPHRVHHIFEARSASTGEPHGSGKGPVKSGADCILQAAAQQSCLLVSLPALFVGDPLSSEPPAAAPLFRLISRLPFLQRAPPAARA